jgi:hypothetical protein
MIVLVNMFEPFYKNIYAMVIEIKFCFSKYDVKYNWKKSFNKKIE